MKIKKIVPQKIEYIKGNLENGKIINWDLIRKAYIDITKPPKHVYQLDIPFDKANLFVIFSKRATGKTTNVILFGLSAYLMFGVKLDWIRQKSDMIKATNINSMFDTIIEYDYISKLTNGKYKSVYYYRKELFLCNYVDGENKRSRPKDIDNKPFIRFNAIDDMQNIKSNYTSPNGDLIIFDEFQTYTNKENEFEDFFHIVSTIRRKRNSVKILFLGNTISPYNYYFREMDITKHIIKMNVNDKMLVKSSKGMNIFLQWTEPTSDKKDFNEYQKNSDIQYFGFDGLNSIVGGGTWDIQTYPHITRDLDKNKIVLEEYYIKFQLFTLNMKLCYEEKKGLFVFVRPCNEKYVNDEKIVFVDYPPMKKNEIFGIGKQIIFCNKLWSLFKMNLFLFPTNDIGELVNEFIRTFS